VHPSLYIPKKQERKCQVQYDSSTVIHQQTPLSLVQRLLLRRQYLHTSHHIMHQHRPQSYSPHDTLQRLTSVWTSIHPYSRLGDAIKTQRQRSSKSLPPAGTTRYSIPTHLSPHHGNEGNMALGSDTLMKETRSGRRGIGGERVKMLFVFKSPLREGRLR
jgi:hypothetical protein